MKRVAMPLQSAMVEKPFAQWGLDVIGPINPKSSKGHAYIITCNRLFYKVARSCGFEKCRFRAVDSFSKRKYLVKIWCTRKIHNRQWLHLHWSKFTNFYGEYGIIMGKSSNYYPQGNGLAESTNKTLIQIIKKTIEANHKNWHNKLIDALWASCLTPKDSTGHSPYTLVYGKEARLPLHLELNSLALTGDVEG
jgi:hypothetical protein